MRWRNLRIFFHFVCPGFARAFFSKFSGGASFSVVFFFRVGFSFSDDALILPYGE